MSSAKVKEQAEILKWVRAEIQNIEENAQVISTIIHQKNEWEERAVTPIHQIIEEEGVEI